MKSYREKIIEFVKKEYCIEPEFLWSKFPTFAVLRNKENKKWFGVLMRIPKFKLGLLENGEVEVLNIKYYPLGIFQLEDENKGFFPAYHMNKKYWVSVLLDGSVKLDRIKNLLQLSFDLVANKKE